MKKSLYLTILFVILLRFWDIVPIGNINRDVYLLVELAYIAFGFVSFKNKWFSLDSKYMLPFWLILIGIILSMIPAQLFHSQSIVQSIKSYRFQILWVIIPLMFWVNPKPKEIVNAATVLTFIMLGVILLKILIPSMFVMPEIDETKVNQDDDELGHFVDGFMLSIIPLFNSLGRIRKSFEWKDAGIIVLCLIFLFLVQNRSTLFTVLVLFAFSILGVNSKYKVLILAGLCAILMFAVVKTADIWQSIIMETTEQLDDEEYERTLAYAYFLSPLANPHWITYLLGNGFLSAKSSSLMADMMEQGIYNSDVGFVGFWNQYGLIPIVVFLSLLIYVLVKRKKFPFMIDLLALFLLVTSVTVGYYGAVSSMFIFAIFYYLLYRHMMINRQLHVNRKFRAKALDISSQHNDKA